MEQRAPEWPHHARHVQYVIDYLEALDRREIQQLMVFLPPRHMKSEIVTVRHTAWSIEKDPSLKTIVAAYNSTLANKFSRKIRRLVRDGRQATINYERRAVDDWETTDGGGVRAAGVAGGVTGHGANLIVIDDPIRSRDEADSPTYRENIWDWYTDDLYMRREVGRDGRPPIMILIMTRWHQDDLAGRILNSKDAHNWSVVSLPSIAGDHDPMGREAGEPLWPEFFPAEELTRIRSATDERGWWSLHQQSPRIGSGAIFNMSWWNTERRYDPAVMVPAYAGVQGYWISWDTGLTKGDSSAYSAAVVGEMHADRTMRIVEVFRDRLTLPELAYNIQALAEKYNNMREPLREVIVEDKSSGTSVIQTLRAQSPKWLRKRLIAWQPRGDKEQRASQASIWCRNGMILLPEPDIMVPWLYDFERELRDFPSGAFKDQVDAFSQLVIYLEPWIERGWNRKVRQNGGVAA